LYELFKYRLVQCYKNYVQAGLPVWGVTVFGERIAERQAKGVY
jgi:hypothetical protein